MNENIARQQMVRQQIVPWNVFDEHVLSVLRDLPRHSFVDPKYTELAYSDVRLPLPQNQTMMTPGMEGSLLQSLELESTDRVLEIGTGSGFLTACLARLCDEVVSVDIFDDLLSAAEQRLKAAEIDNVLLQNMDALETLPDGPFDAIAVTGSVPVIDTRFVDTLRPGGRLFMLVGESPIVEAFVIVRGQDSDWYGKTLFETDIKPLLCASHLSRFVF